MLGTSQKTGIVSPRDIPPELLEKYSRQGPRYTSYPTALQFNAEFDREAMREQWLNSDRGNPLSLYVHIPFCARRCLYCGCHTVIGARDDGKRRYVDALLDEMKTASSLLGEMRNVRQLAIGGGTPTSLPQAEMARLVDGMRQRFNFESGGERSIEIDPRSVDASYLDLLLELGFNRFSFGLQDLETEVMRMIGREQDEEHIGMLLGRLRSRGVTAINLDLIYGLPGQSPESFERTLSRVIDFAPARLAVFGYAHVPWLHPHQRALEKYQRPSPAERAVLFDIAYRKLLEAGYRHVGMDHFALPSDELVVALDAGRLSRNFMGYTTQRGLDLAAFGSSAISGVGNAYVQDAKDVEDYMARASAREMPWDRGLLMSSDDVIRRDLIIDMFCNFRIDITEFSRRHEIDFHSYFSRELQELESFERDGLLVVGHDGISLKTLGRFFVRNVCMVFDLYLEAQTGTSRFSQTV